MRPGSGPKLASDVSCGDSCLIVTKETSRAKLTSHRRYAGPRRTDEPASPSVQPHVVALTGHALAGHSKGARDAGLKTRYLIIGNLAAGRSK